MLLEDLQVVLKVAEFRSITAAATRLDLRTPTELWLVCRGRQSITPAARLLRDAFKKKSPGILNQLAEKGILDDSILNWSWNYFLALTTCNNCQEYFTSRLP